MKRQEQITSLMLCCAAALCNLTSSQNLCLSTMKKMSVTICARIWCLNTLGDLDVSFRVFLCFVRRKSYLPEISVVFWFSWHSLDHRRNPWNLFWSQAVTVVMVRSNVCSCELVLTAWQGKPRQGQEEGQGNLITGGSKAAARTGICPLKKLKLPLWWQLSSGKHS